ncbi:DNA excision repair protein ERCC-1-like isoform X1 [Phragmites australis]|uniref:DNA excision repair protein ERCC-1-like isoform X1 n=1 Tax=Phragmites australis TaxID=29695 RepID=UPI002D77C4B9|nr:DNA excision repair protein ERCC-1-like isoform X1 [Phragmites australis]
MVRLAGQASVSGAAMDGEREQRGPEWQPGKNIIKIPSYQEVFSIGPSSASSPPSYNPPLASSGAAAASSSSSSGSFSQAFSFLKSSEFYSPPPPPPQPTTAQRPPQASPSVPVPQSKNAILVSHRQKGNPLLKHIRNARWTFADIVPDYVLRQSSCALYISIRYHLLHPDYLYYRIRELQKNFRLHVILCHIDVEDVVKPLHEITRTALLHDCTLLCGWSMEECGRYLETIKVYENKPADSICEHMDNDYLSLVPEAILDRRLHRCPTGAVQQVLVQWSGWPPSLVTWEDEKALHQRFPKASAWGQASFQGEWVVTSPSHTDNTKATTQGRPEALRWGKGGRSHGAPNKLASV